jgi:endonuclease-3
MNDKDIHPVVAILKKEVSCWDAPIVELIAQKSRDPFQVLISCILSLRTQDRTTAEAAKRLFALARTPEAMVKLKPKTIEKTIYPVGFYRNKAKTILNLSKTLIAQYHSKVPNNLDELLRLKGVGRKTANIVITRGFGKPGIAVDTHVHRITNRWGYVKTKTPDKTEFALRAKLPKQYWRQFNYLLVAFGQSLCRPLSPRCSRCPIEKFCDRAGVAARR